MADPRLAPGEAWMRGDLPSSVYFAMARQSVRPSAGGRRPLRDRLTAWRRRHG